MYHWGIDTKFGVQAGHHWATQISKGENGIFSQCRSASAATSDARDYTSSLALYHYGGVTGYCSNGNTVSMAGGRATYDSPNTVRGMFAQLCFNGTGNPACCNPTGCGWEDGGSL